MSGNFPNLFLVGAMRSGTTALHEALGRHPDIFMSAVKEPAYFATPEQLAGDSRVAFEAGYAGDRPKYEALFAAAGESRWVGESSTHYTKRPRITGIAQRMVAEAPDARVLYVVRDPVERTLSHYRYAVRMKYERRPPLEALQGEPIYCSISDYAMQITPFVEVFGRDAVHVAVLERLASPDGLELKRLYAWLGLTPPAGGDGAAFEQRNQVFGELQRARGPAVLHDAGRSGWYQQLARTLIPKSLRASVRRLLNQPIAADDVRTPEVVAMLRRTHEPHARAVEELLGGRIAEWTTLRPPFGRPH